MVQAIKECYGMSLLELFKNWNFISLLYFYWSKDDLINFCYRFCKVLGLLMYIFFFLMIYIWLRPFTHQKMLLYSVEISLLCPQGWCARKVCCTITAPPFVAAPAFLSHPRNSVPMIVQKAATVLKANTMKKHLVFVYPCKSQE